MFNQVTDRFRLVQMELVKAVPVFGRTVAAIENYSLEVFRGEFHFGSVRIHKSGIVSNEEREYAKMKVYNGDVIYRVSLVSQPLSISGHITTEDKYVRIYDITFDSVVSDSVAFVRGYRQGRDPVNITIGMFKTSLQKYASLSEHDKLIPLKRVNDEWNNRLYANTGMKVTQISQWSFRDDPKRAEMFSILQEAEKDKVSVTTQAEIQKLRDRLERERDAEQRAFEREQEMLQHMHDLHSRLRETAAREVTDILQERIRDTFERGASINEVAEDSMKLLNAFHESLHRGSVVDSTLSSSSDTGANGISTEGGTTARGNVETDPSFHTPPNLADILRTTEKKTEQEL